MLKHSGVRIAATIVLVLTLSSVIIAESKSDSGIQTVGCWQETISLPQPMSTPFELLGQELIIHNDRAHLLRGQTSRHSRLASVCSTGINPSGRTGSSIAGEMLKALGSPDLDAAFIMQTPRYDYDAAKNRHALGDQISFVATVANRGVEPTGSFTYRWTIDGSLISEGTHSSLDPAETAELRLSWTWQTGSHKVQVALDPENTISEVSELNNVVEDRTDALAVGFWVEQSVYDYFNENQIALCLGSVSWEDWAQRQLRVWNEIFADATTPLTPQGVLERVRLDKVVVVPDGALPSCATNFPAPSDKTVDLQWGFPSELVGVPSGHTCGHLNYYFDHPESQNVEYSLMHELSHARYLVDLYGLNVHVPGARLASDVAVMDSTLSTDRNVEEDPLLVVPAHLSVGGELIVCESKVDNRFVICSRGAEGTVTRAHVAGDLVNLAVVRLQDGEGNLIQGGPSLPLIGFDDHLYYNRYPDDLMSGGREYQQHSAFALNRIAGRRPVCGNYNAPCNIGEYLNDIPEHNTFAVRDPAGEPIVGARLEVYQASGLPLWYGKCFDKSADITRFTNEEGEASVGSFPFGGDSVVMGYGYSNAVLLLKIASGDVAEYRFFEVTEANEAHWSGNQLSATYVITADLPQGRTPSRVFLPAVAKEFSKPQTLLELRFEGSLDGADGELAAVAGVTFAPGHNGQGALLDDGDRLSYAADQNIHREQGSIQFWLEPLWNGNDGGSYVFFEIGDAWFNRMRIMKDGANNFRFMVWSPDTEYGVAYNVSAWNAGEWHHVRVTWNENEIALYIDGAAKDTETSMVLPARLNSTLHIGSTSGGHMQAQAVIDEFMIYSRP